MLMLVAVVVAPVMAVIWFWEQFGLAGAITVAAIAAGFAWAKWAGDKRKRATQDQAFDLAVAHTLVAKENPEERRADLRHWNRIDRRRAEALRCVQILHDGMYHATHSANPQTAQSRMESARAEAARLAGQYSAVMPEPTLQRVRQALQQAEAEYATARYVLPAQRLLGKARALKTRAAILRNAELARDQLNAALMDARSDKARVAELMREVVDLVRANA